MAKFNITIDKTQATAELEQFRTQAKAVGDSVEKSLTITIDSDQPKRALDVLLHAMRSMLGPSEQLSNELDKLNTATIHAGSGASKLSSRLQKVKDRLDDYKKQIQEVSFQLGSLDTSSGKNVETARALRSQLDNLHTSYNRLNSSMDGAAIHSREFSTASKQAAISSDKFSDSLDDLSRSQARVEAEARDAKRALLEEADAIRKAEEAADKRLRVNTEYNKQLAKNKTALKAAVGSQAALAKETSKSTDAINALGKRQGQVAYQARREFNKLEKTLGNVTKRTGFMNSGFAKFSIIMSGIAATLFVFQSITRWIGQLADLGEELQSTFSSLRFEIEGMSDATESLVYNMGTITGTSLADNAQLAKEIASLTGGTGYEAYLEDASKIMKYPGMTASKAASIAVNDYYGQRDAYLQYADQQTIGTAAGKLKETTLNVIRDFFIEFEEPFVAVLEKLAGFIKKSGKNAIEGAKEFSEKGTLGKVMYVADSVPTGVNPLADALTGSRDLWQSATQQWNSITKDDQEKGPKVTRIQIDPADIPNTTSPPPDTDKPLLIPDRDKLNQQLYSKLGIMSDSHERTVLGGFETARYNNSLVWGDDFANQYYDSQVRDFQKQSIRSDVFKEMPGYDKTQLRKDESLFKNQKIVTADYEQFRRKEMAKTYDYYKEILGNEHAANILSKDQSLQLEEDLFARKSEQLKIFEDTSGLISEERVEHDLKMNEKKYDLLNEIYKGAIDFSKAQAIDEYNIKKEARDKEIAYHEKIFNATGQMSTKHYALLKEDTAEYTEYIKSAGYSAEQTRVARIRKEYLDEKRNRDAILAEYQFFYNTLGIMTGEHYALEEEAINAKYEMLSETVKDSTLLEQARVRELLLLDRERLHSTEDMAEGVRVALAMMNDEFETGAEIAFNFTKSLREAAGVAFKDNFKAVFTGSDASLKNFAESIVDIFADAATSSADRFLDTFTEKLQGGFDKVSGFFSKMFGGGGFGDFLGGGITMGAISILSDSLSDLFHRKAVDRWEYNDGTGTVLGDADAGSKSIVNALGILEDVNADSLTELKGIYSEVKSLNANLTGLSTSVVQTFGSFTAEDLGVSLVNSNFLGGLSRKKSTVEKAGLQTEGISISDLEGGADLIIRTFARIKEKSSSLFGLFSSESYSTQYGAVDDGMQDLFTKMFRNIGSSMVEISKGLGADNMEQVLSYMFDPSNIDLKDLTGEEINEKITAWISSEADKAMSELFGGLIGKYQELNEGLYETAVRLIAEKESILEALRYTGHTFEGTAFEAIEFAQVLIDLAGGLDVVTASAVSYYEKFYTDNERMNHSLLSMNETLGEFDKTLPKTREGFRDLVEGLDLTEEADQRLYLALLSITDAADAFYKTVEDRQKIVQDGLKNSKDYVKDALWNATDHSALETALKPVNEYYTELFKTMLLNKAPMEDLIQIMKDWALVTKTTKDSILEASMASSDDFVANLKWKYGNHSELDAAQKEVNDFYQPLYDSMAENGASAEQLAAIMEEWGWSIDFVTEKVTESIQAFGETLEDRIKIDTLIRKIKGEDETQIMLGQMADRYGWAEKGLLRADGTYDWATIGMILADFENATGDTFIRIAERLGLTEDDVITDIDNLVEHIYELGDAAKETAAQLVEDWTNLSSGLSDQIQSLTFGSDNPADIYERLAAVSAAISDRTAGMNVFDYLKKLDSGYEKKQVVEDLQSLWTEYLSLSQEAYDRPSSDYQYRYDKVMNNLEQLESYSFNTLTDYEVQYRQLDALNDIRDYTKILSEKAIENEDNTTGDTEANGSSAININVNGGDTTEVLSELVTLLPDLIEGSGPIRQSIINLLGVN